MKRPIKPPKRPRGRPRLPQTEDKILTTTLLHLAEHGYVRMSLDAIAADAGTTKPTIYLRWKGKEELAIAALDRLQTQELPTLTGKTADDLRALLRDFQRKLLGRNGMAMIGTLLAEEKHTPKLLGLFRKKIASVQRQGLMGVLKAGKERGEFEPNADLDAAVDMLVGSFYARYLSEGTIPQDWALRVVTLMLRGLEKNR